MCSSHISREAKPLAQAAEAGRQHQCRRQLCLCLLMGWAAAVSQLSVYSGLSEDIMVACHCVRNALALNVAAQVQVGW